MDGGSDRVGLMRGHENNQPPFFIPPDTLPFSRPDGLRRDRSSPPPQPALMGITEEQIKSMHPGPLYAQSFVATLVAYYVLARFIAGTASLMEGIEVACWVWLGFVTTVQFTASLFSTRPRTLYFLDTGYQLVTFVAAGAIIAAWK